MSSSSISGLHYTTSDVFTTTRFGGNPLAIVYVPHDKVPTQEEKQTIAREFNYSETVFIHLPTPGTESKEWRIDIFLTEHELPFAGHPTIGSACALASMYPTLQNFSLITKAGPIPTTIARNGLDGSVVATSSIPHNVHVHKKKLRRESIVSVQPRLKNIAEQALNPAGASVVSIVKGMTFALIRLDSLESLGKATLYSIPAILLVELDPDWAPSFVGLYFYVVHEDESTARKQKVSCRMIEQGLEDPATGSAASCLASFLAMEMSKNGKTCGDRVEFELRQGVEMGRESLIGVEVAFKERGVIDEVKLRGSAIAVMEGRLL